MPDNQQADRSVREEVTDEDRELEGDDWRVPPRNRGTLIAILRWFNDD